MFDLNLMRFKITQLFSVFAFISLVNWHQLMFCNFSYRSKKNHFLGLKKNLTTAAVAELFLCLRISSFVLKIALKLVK